MSKISKRTFSLMLSGLIVFGTAIVADAQGFVVNAQIQSQAVGDGTFNYTILLQNDSSSTESIGTFWFAWVPDAYGYDLLTSIPTITETPVDWYGYVTGGSSYYYPDGYSLEFYAYSTPLAPGDSLTFQFNSPDSPDVLAANSPYLAIPALTSYLYSGIFSGDTSQIVVQPVPEPSASQLSAIGIASLFFVGSRKFKKANANYATSFCARQSIRLK